MAKREEIIELIQQVNSIVHSFTADKKNFTSILKMLNQPKELTEKQFKQLKGDIDKLHKSLHSRAKEQTEQQMVDYISDALALLEESADWVKRPILQTPKIYFIKKTARPQSSCNNQGMDSKVILQKEKSLIEGCELKAVDQRDARKSTRSVQQANEAHSFWRSHEENNRGKNSCASALYRPLLLGYPRR